MRPLCVLLSSFLLIPPPRFAEDRPASRQSLRPEPAHSLDRLEGRRLARSADSVQGGAGLPQADRQAAAGHGPRAGYRPALHPPAPRHLGRAVSPPGIHDDQAASKTEQLLQVKGLSVGFAFHPDYVHNGYIYFGLNGPNERGGRRPRWWRYTVDREPPHRIDPASKRADHRVGVQRPRRRRRRLRQRRVSLRHLGRRLERLRRAPDRADPRRPARRGAPDRRRPPRPGPELLRAEGQPVRQSPRRPARDLGVRPAQSLADELRPQDGPALGRPERAGPVGAGVPDQEGGQLRLEHRRGLAHVHGRPQGGPRPDPAADRRALAQRGPLAHRRPGLPRPEPARPGRGLCLRRLVHRQGLGHQARRHQGPLAPRARRHAVQHHGLRHRPLGRDVRDRPPGRVLPLRADDRGRQAQAAVPDEAERDRPVRLGAPTTSPIRPPCPSSPPPRSGPTARRWSDSRPCRTWT